MNSRDAEHIGVMKVGTASKPLNDTIVNYSGKKDIQQTQIMNNTNITTTRKQTKMEVKLDDKPVNLGTYLKTKKKNSVNNNNNNSTQVNTNSASQRFFCNYPNCNKSFTRLEHLSRHNLNHWPKKIFECSFVFPDTNVKCGKTFVRKDLLVRHERRHANGNNRLVSKNNKQLRQLKFLQNELSSVHTKNINSNSNSNLDVNPSSNNQLNNMGNPLPRGNLPVTDTNMLSYSNVDPNPSAMFNQINNIGNVQSYDQFFDWVFDNNDNRNHHNVSNENNKVGLNTYTIGNNRMGGIISNNQSGLKNSNQRPPVPSNGLVDNTNMISSVQQSAFPSVPNSLQFASTEPRQVPQQQYPTQMKIVSQNHVFNDTQSNMNILQNSDFVMLQNNNMNPPPIIISSTQNQKQESQSLLHPPNSNQDIQIQVPPSDSAPPKLQDLYSLDYLASDPLQSFMQELSSMYPNGINNITAGSSLPVSNSNNSNKIVLNELENMSIPSTMNISTPNNNRNFIHTPESINESRLASLNNTKVDNGLFTADSTTSLLSPQSKTKTNKVKKNKHVVPKSQSTFIDNRRNLVKDNYLVQKSNVNYLKKQTFENGSSSRYSLKTKTSNNMNNKKELLESMKNVPSIFFPDPRTKYQLSSEKCKELYDLIPELRNVQSETLEISLKAFWKNFHPQYRILHKPSFNVNQQPPILILSLIMTGASSLGVNFRKTVSDPICGPLRWIIFSHPDFQPPSSTYIILSLLLLESYEKTSTNRYLHERSYLHHGTTIQLLRRTPSLGGHPLRDKTKDTYVDDNGNDEPNELTRVLYKWIEFESLKRVAFFAFYMDVSHAVVFGYMNLFISFRQIQLGLPCPDKIWESYDLSFEVLKESGYGIQGNDQINNQTFLFAFKNLMREVLGKMINNSNKELNSIENADGCTIENKSNGSKTSGSEATDRFCDNISGALHLEDLMKRRNKVTSKTLRPITSVLGKKLMLTGILSIMFQCQEENDDQLISNIVIKGSNEHNITWKEIVSFAINYWMFEVQKSCNKEEKCSLLKEVNGLENNENTGEDLTDKNSLEEKALQVTEWNNNDYDCKLPVYHMSQIILRIFHHDYYIAAGAPWRMNVMIGDKEFQSIQQRIIQFSKDTYTGGVTIVYAYQFLFEMFVRKDPNTNKITIDKTYDINTDIVYTRPNSIALVTLLIWTYSFTLYGPEIVLWDNEDDNEEYDSTESKERESVKKKNEELQMRYIPVESFESYITRMYHHLYIDKDSGDVVSYQKRVWEKAVLLQTISGQNNMIGFIKFIKEILEKSYWELGREFGRLLNNCIQRSLGKKTHVCHDMYDV